MTGKKGKYIPVEKAIEHVFGYTIFNDASAQDFQFKDGKWTRGKSFDTFAPTGPYIITKSQLKNTEMIWLSVHGLSVAFTKTAQLKTGSLTLVKLFTT